MKRIINTLLCASAVLNLAGCEDAKIKEAQDVIRARLGDPEATKFRNLVKSAEDDAVCGEFSAKNAMGGYSGYQVFVVMNGEFFLMTDRSIELDKVKQALKTEKLSGDITDPVFAWSFCLESRDDLKKNASGI